jgi:RNA polymerase primary sigma factor
VSGANPEDTQDDPYPARNELVERYYPLCRAIARHYRGYKVDTDDLAQEAALGLIRAAEKYRDAGRLSFGSFAARGIKSAIRDALSYNGPVWQLPKRALRIRARYLRAEAEVSKGREDAPNPSETLDAMGVVRGSTRDQVLSVVDALGVAATSQERPRDFVIPDRSSKPEFSKEDVDWLRNALDQIPDDERTLLSVRHGLDGQPPRSYKEMARMSSLTREGIRKRVLKAEACLRRRWESDREEIRPRSGANPRGNT